MWSNESAGFPHTADDMTCTSINAANKYRSVLSITGLFSEMKNLKTVNISNPPMPIDEVAIENCEVNTAKPKKR